MHQRQQSTVLFVGVEPQDTESVRGSNQWGRTQFRVKTVDTPPSGFNELAAHDVDCIVSAYDLPDQTGVAFLETVRERYGDIPFVLVDPEGDEVVASEAIAAGVTEYVPSADVRLRDRIRDATEQAGVGSRSTARFEALFAASQHPIVVLNPDGTVHTANRTARQCVGADNETDRPFWETAWWDEQTRSAVRRWVTTAADGERVEYEATGKLFGDSYRTVSGEIIPVTEDGVVSELVVVTQVAPERDRGELAKTKEQLALALDAADAAVWEMDVDTRELYWDERSQRLWGYEPGEFDGTFSEFKQPVHPDDWERLETAYQTAIETGGSYQTQIRVDAGDDSMRWVEAAGPVRTDETGASRRLIGLSTDITERKRREQQRRRQNRRLEEFARVVSHDLRNPLNIAQARTTMLIEQCGDAATEHAGPISDALARMECIIEDTLTLAKKGEAVDTMETLGITEMVESSWASVETGDATVRIDDDFSVQADADRLKHVFENLFRNAVEHGAADVTVRIGCAGESRFYVEDDGPGITADRREEVFDPGQTSRREGTGFGLTIVKRIANAHGWTVAVTDGRDGGARFEFETDGLMQT